VKGIFTMAIRRLAAVVVGLLLLLTMPLASAQMQLGENTKLNASGLFSGGYAGAFGNQVAANHEMNFGFNGNVSGSYYNPNFLSFNIIPYYNQSQANSTYQSLTGATGVSASANLFSGSHFPGSINYHDDHNSSGTFGLEGLPNFTTHGHGQGFGVGWSALLPGLPTLSVNYAQGSGSGTVYGTNQETGSDTKLFNVRSSYAIEGFRLNGFYDHNNLHTTIPAFLSGEQESVSRTGGHDFGFGANHNLPLNGSFFANYTRSQATTDFLGSQDTTSSYTTSTETAGANFHPTHKLGLFTNESYTDNLSGYLSQNLINSGIVQTPINLGTGSKSLTLGGGASYQFTNYLGGQAQATFYDQSYFGKSYTGSYISGTVNYGRRLLDMFTFSGGVVDSSDGKGSNAVGLIGSVNYFHPIKGWETSGSFSYAQNVQSLLITYTTSYYNYSARLHRRFAHGLVWTASFSGSHSGLTNQKGSDSHSEGYSTSFSMRRFAVNGNYSKSSGQSILTSTGLAALPPTPGVPIGNLILYGGTSYGGGISATPVRHLTVAGTFSRALSNTLSGTADSRNSTEIFNAQLQYRLRRIGVLGGFTRFSQGISAAGIPPGNANSFFIGVSRWFDFF
jgi:hypothetical protein